MQPGEQSVEVRVTGSGSTRRRTLLVVLVALVVVAVLAVGGVVAWERAHRTALDEALAVVPAASLRVGFTDWTGVRRALGADLGSSPGRGPVERLITKAYDTDLSAASSIDESAVALQEMYGFGPATAQWEAYAQSRAGATMVLKPADGTDFDTLAGNLRDLGYQAPKSDDGVWRGGIDLVAQIDPTLSPEVQYVVLLKDQGLIVSSDTSAYAAKAGRVARGDGASLSGQAGIGSVSDRLGEPADAIVWADDFACEDLAMSQADREDQATADRLVQRAGGVTPLAGLAMAMQPDRRLQVVAHFEDGDEARKNLRPRAELAVGEAVGRGGSFADDLRLTRSRAIGDEVVLDLRPRQKTGFVLSALYDGPVLFATC